MVSAMWKIPIHVTLITSIFSTMSLAGVADFPFREVASFAMPALVQTWDLLIEAWYRDLCLEWAGLFYFILFTLALCCCCSCEEFLTGIYPAPSGNTAPHKPLSQLITPVCSPPASDDDKTSDSTSVNENGQDSRDQARAKGGLFASVCDERCNLIDGIHEKRLNPKVCKRRGSKHATLLDTDELYSSGTRALPTYSEWVNAQLRTFHRGHYIRERDKRRCHVGDCFRSGVSIALFGTSTKSFRVLIEKALMVITSGKPSGEQESPSARRPTGEFPAPRPPSLDGGLEDPPPASASSSRRPSFNSLDSGGLFHSPSVSETCAKLGKLHEQKRNSHDFSSTCWQPDVVIPDEPESVKRPSLTHTGPARSPGFATPPGLVHPPPVSSIPSSSVSYPVVDPGVPIPMHTGHLGLSGLIPSSVKRPREGIQPDTYPFETLSKSRQPSSSNDPMEITMERMGERMGEMGQINNKEMKMGRFHEYVVFATRGFGSFKTIIGTGRYGADLEASTKRQSVTHREILSRNGVRVPITNRIARACPTLDWGLEYGSTPGASTLMLNDFVPWPATKLDEFRISGNKLETRGKAPASIYLANASIERHNRMFGSVYGEEQIAEREQARALLVELHRRHEVLYTPEVSHLAFEAMVRNFIDLVEEGVRRMLRVTRKGFRRESLSEYDLLPRGDGSPAWISPNGFDVVSTSGFWQAEIIPRFDAKLEDGLVSNALKGGLVFPSSAVGETMSAPLGGEEKQVQFPNPGLLIEEEVKLSYTHAPIKDDDVRIFRGQSSWRSCPRGATCASAHCTIPTKTCTGSSVLRLPNEVDTVPMFASPLKLCLGTFPLYGKQIPVETARAFPIHHESGNLKVSVRRLNIGLVKMCRRFSILLSERYPMISVILDTRL